MYDTIRDYFENLNPICYLSEQSKGIVLKNSDMLELKKGKYLFKRGETDNKSYFLLEGVVELQSPNNTFQVHTGTDTANYALAQFQPRQYTARVKKNSVFLTVDKTLLDSLAEKDGLYNLERPSGMVVSEEDTGADVDWMTRILQSDLFSKLPPSDIQKIFSRIEPIEVKKGEIVVRQDDAGDFFYIIEVGRAEVIRKASKTSSPVKLEALSIGDYFGEEALVSECPRNATVIMLTDGDLMRLPKTDFVELIRKPILRSYQLKEIEELHNQGAEWIDVRFPAEYLEYQDFDKLDIPLHIIRKQIEKLDPDKKYIVCCEDGNKSAVAAFLLSLKGFDAAFLEGGLINCKNQIEENGFDLSFLNDKNTDDDDSKVIDFIPRHASKIQQQHQPETKTKAEHYETTQELPVEASPQDKALEQQKKQIEQQLEAEKKISQSESKRRLNKQAEAKKATDEKELEKQIERQKKEIEKQIAEEAAKQKKEIEKQLAEQTAKQKKEIEKQLEDEARKEKKALEKQLTEERAKLKAEAEKRLADEATKQKKEIEKQLVDEARQEKKDIERQLGEERAKQKAIVEKQLAEQAAKQKKEIEKQLAEELKKEKEALERQLADERAKQKAVLEKQLAEEAAKQKKEIEKQLAEDARRQKKEIERQLAEEKARQRAAAEKRLAEEKAKQRKLIELQLIEERAKQKAAVEKQLEEERTKQKAVVEKQMVDEVAKQKKAIEEQMAREAAKKKHEIEQQLANEADRRKKAIEEQLAAQELKQKAVIDDIITTGKVTAEKPEHDDDSETGDNTDSISKLINHYRIEKEKALEEINDENRKNSDDGLTKIKSLNKKNEKGRKDLKKLKAKLTNTLQANSKSGQSKESNKRVIADKHKVLSKRYNILNDPRFREHINRLNVQKEKEFIEEIKTFKKELDMDVSDGHEVVHTDNIPEHLTTTQNLIAELDLDGKSEKTIQADIESWIKDQESLEQSPKRMELIEEKKKLMQKLQRQFMEDKKIKKIRNHTLMTEIKSALDKKKDK